MPRRIPDRYFICRFFNPPGETTLELSDERNVLRRFAVPASVHAEFAAIADLAKAMFPELHRALAEPRPIRAATGQRVPLPVFCSSPVSSPWWERHLMAELTREFGPGVFEVVRLTMAETTRRPFTLPFRFLGVGNVGHQALQGVSSLPWVKRALAEAGQHGLQLASAKDARDIWLAPAEVVICAGQDIPALWSESRELPRDDERRPRLVVAFAHSSDWTAGLEPEGVSTMFVEARSGAEARILAGLFEALVHDCPLHEALPAALRPDKEILGEGLLLSTPQLNHSLRMVDAFEQFRDAFLHRHGVEPLAPREEPAPSTESFGGPKEAGIAKVRRAQREYVKALESARHVGAEFMRERTGFEPLARGVAAVSRAEESRQAMDAAMGEILADAALVERLARDQRRVINAHLLEEDAVGRFSPVRRDRPLRHGEDYRLLVQIGAAQRGSLVEAPPSIDPLLPDPERNEDGWTLDVVVFEKDFVLRSAALQSVFLPRLGGSEAVSFDLRAPADGRAAELRFGIYLRNQLVQSFVLRASLVDRRDGPIATVVCDFSQTENFRNLATLQPRALSIGLNEDDNGTHRLMLKNDSHRASLKLDVNQMERIAERFRTCLRDATVDAAGRARFPVAFDASHQPLFEETIRQLARLGGEMFQALLQQDATEIAQSLRRAPDQPLQIVRFNMSHAYPWPVVYDFRLPDDHAGPPARVCRGPADPAPCGCTRDRATGYCLNGFWGIRHELEQLAGQEGKPTDARLTIGCSPTSPEVFLALDDPEDRFAQEVRLALAAQFTRSFAVLEPAGELVKHLWTPAKRPAVFVAFGRMKQAPAPQEPAGPRFSLPPGSRWLLPRHLIDEAFDQGAWTNPRSLVLLVMCHSGAVEVGAFNDFALAFLHAGASGVLGTETFVFPGIARLFTAQVLGDLKNGQTMGQAMRRFVTARAVGGDPTGFVFTYIGSADLSLT